MALGRIGTMVQRRWRCQGQHSTGGKGDSVETTEDVVKVIEFRRVQEIHGGNDIQGSRKDAWSYEDCSQKQT
jgi:hypothetical protein